MWNSGSAITAISHDSIYTARRSSSSSPQFMHQNKRLGRNWLMLLLMGLRLAKRASCSLLGALCYDTNGVVLINDTACSPDLEHSFCCGTYFACLDTGLCSNMNTWGLTGGNGNLQRATCTDPTWQSAQCPKFCLDRKSIPC